MAKKKDFYNQSISGEDIELLAQFTGKLDKVLHNKRVSYLRKKNQKETKEVSFEANATDIQNQGVLADKTVKKYDTVTLPVPQREGDTFLGWYKDQG